MKSGTRLRDFRFQSSLKAANLGLEDSGLEVVGMKGDDEIKATRNRDSSGYS